MIEIDYLKAVIKEHYNLNLNSIEFFRKGGNFSYIADDDNKKYFIKLIGQQFMETALHSLDIQLFLQKYSIPVPIIIKTKDQQPSFTIKEKDDTKLLIIYEFIEGEEANPHNDAENIGSVIARLHNVMEDYPKELIVHDKYFFITRYIDILRKKNYPKIEQYQALGDLLWSKIESLPKGYCHGDMYRGNILKSKDGTLYVLDFDTSCYAFPMYDVALICNATNYFNYSEESYYQSKAIYERFLKSYLNERSLSNDEIATFYDLIAVYHFQLQATIIGINGLDCVDDKFIDNQLEWLKKWLNQSYKEKLH